MLTTGHSLMEHSHGKDVGRRADTFYNSRRVLINSFI
jgi:hypothetical protein